MNDHSQSTHPPPDGLHPLRRFLLPFVIITVMVLGKLANGGQANAALSLLGIKLDFLIFGGTLAFITASHRLKWEPRDISLSGLGLVLAHQLYMGTDLVGHLMHDHGHELRCLVNIGGLLLGFAVMSKCFENSKLGDWLPAILPDDWKGPAMLLGFVLMLSAMLDNIASAMIGGVIAAKVFHGRLTIGFLAAIVACANAGGAPSVVGDTTTTMMWIAGVPPVQVLPAIVGTVGAGVIIIYFAAKQQDAYQRIQKDPEGGLTLGQVQWSFIVCVFWALAGCITANVLFDLPALGVWAGLVVGAFMIGFGKMPFGEAGHIAKDTVFILSLVAMASLMPVKELPAPSWPVTLCHGFVSAVFDNIPLTKLCLQQGGYDWGLLAFAVGFGGSMTWFGSSAGVALCSAHPEGKNVLAWLRQGWFVPAGYLVGFMLMVGVTGWHPKPIVRPGVQVDSHADPMVEPAAPVTSAAAR